MSFFKSAFIRLLSTDSSRILDNKIRSYSRTGGLRIINFHRVISNDICDYRLMAGNPTASIFERIISFLNQRYEFISLEKYVNQRHLLDPKKIYLALTFDDGYQDNYKNALPILRKYAVPVTIFASIDALDGKRLWFQKIYCAINQYAGDAIEDPCTGKSISTLNKWDAMNRISNSFKSCTYAEYSQGLARLMSYCKFEEGDINYATENMMSWKHVKELKDDELVAFGSHAKSHMPLVSLPESMLADELTDSHQKLKNETDNKEIYFAYPNSRYDKRVIDAVKKAGYKAAFTMERGCNNVNTNLFEINREYVSNDIRKISIQLSDFDIKMKSILGIID